MNASQRISFIFYPILFGVTLITSSLDDTFMPYGISVVLAIVLIANCIKCLDEYRKGNISYASIILIFSCIIAVHIIIIQFSNFYNYTSYIVFIFLECIYFITLLLAAKQTVAAIRASFTVLFLKGFCLGILPIGTLIPKGTEKIVFYYTIGVFPPLIGMPVLFIAFIEVMTTGLYVYKMVADPAGWRRPFY